MNEDREENGYPPRSHDCQPAEVELTDSFEESQLDVERREKTQRRKGQWLCGKMHSRIFGRRAQLAYSETHWSIV